METPATHVERRGSQGALGKLDILFLVLYAVSTLGMTFAIFAPNATDVILIFLATGLCSIVCLLTLMVRNM